MSNKIFKIKSKNKFWIIIVLIKIFLIGFPVKSHSNPTVVFEDTNFKPTETESAKAFRLNPAGAKAAQAAARGSIVPNKTSGIVAGAIALGTFVASVRGDAGGTAGGLEKSLNP